MTKPDSQTCDVYKIKYVYIYTYLHRRKAEEGIEDRKTILTLVIALSLKELKDSSQDLGAVVISCRRP